VKKQEKKSIVFIDELDSIGCNRDTSDSNIEIRFVSQLLVLMDGFTVFDNIIVIGATNRPNSIDLALKRTGRFDLEIEIPLPNEKGRKQIFNIYNTKYLVQDFDCKRLVIMTEGWSCADIHGLFKVANMECLKRSFNYVDGKFIKQTTDVLTNMDDIVLSYETIQKKKMKEITSIYI